MLRSSEAVDKESEGVPRPALSSSVSPGFSVLQEIRTGGGRWGGGEEIKKEKTP